MKKLVFDRTKVLSVYTPLKELNLKELKKALKKELAGYFVLGFNTSTYLLCGYPVITTCSDKDSYTKGVLNKITLEQILTRNNDYKRTVFNDNERYEFFIEEKYAKEIEDNDLMNVFD